MDSIMLTFVTVLAWAAAALSALVTGARLYGAANYGTLQQALDQYKGVRRTFPIMWPGSILIVSVAFLIARYFS